MPTLHLVIAEAAVEPVPEALWSHPSVAKNAKLRGKRPGQLLLDDTYHHAAMRKAADQGRFEEPERRGRPDILHTTLLVALESRLNRDRRLQIWVHTRNDELVTLVPDLRLQRAQHRFYGLLEQLLEHGAVPPDGRADVLMSRTTGMTLAHVIGATGAGSVLVMDEAGDDEPLEAVFGAAAGQVARSDAEPAPRPADVAVVIGGFPTGRLRSDLAGIQHRRIALGAEPLTAWSVAADVVTRFRLATGGT